MPANPITTYFDPCVQDRALDAVVRILLTSTPLVDWTGHRSDMTKIGRSTSFEAIEATALPFILVGALSESEDFSVSRKSDVDFSIGVMIAFEDFQSFGTLGEASYLSVVQEVKRKLYEAPYHTLKIAPDLETLSAGIKSFEVVAYDSFSNEAGQVEAACTLRVVHKLRLNRDDREPMTP